MTKPAIGTRRACIAALLTALCLQLLLPVGAVDRVRAAQADPGEALQELYSNSDYNVLYTPDDRLSVRDAEQAIQAAVELGLCGDASELEPQRDFALGAGRVYRLRQVCGGVPVFGRHVTLIADAQGVVRAASGDCAPTDQLGAQPEADWAALARALAESLSDAELIAAETALGADAVRSASEPVVYADAGAPRWALLVQGMALTGRGAWQAVVDAATGEVLRIIDNVQTLGELELDSYPWSAQLPYDAALGGYALRDDERNFELYDAQGNMISIAMAFDADPLIEMHTYLDSNPIGEYFHFEPVGITVSQGMLDAPVALPDPSDADALQRQIFASLALAYDYFDDVLGWEGFNGRRAPIKVVYNCSGLIEGLELTTDNAGILSGTHSAVLSFLGDKGREVAYDPNTTVHEYAHGVEYSISCIVAGSGDEGAGVKEALSDAFAELAEAYATGADPDWKSLVRSHYPIADDSLYDYADYAAGVDGHESCTIATYALYQLWQQWRDTMSVEECMYKMSNLLFSALFLLPHDATFFDLAYALRTSGRMLEAGGELSLSQYEAVCDSLQRVGILRQASTCIVRVTDDAGAPIEGAQLRLHTGAGDAPVLEDDYLTSGYGLATLRTDAHGLASIRLFDGGGRYLIQVRADGFEDYSGWADTIVEQADSGDVRFLINEVQLHPQGSDPGQIQVAEFDDGLLRAQLQSLIEQYGTVAVGADEYPPDADGLYVPAQRLTGLLGADIFDYDGDGQSELLTLRLDAEDGYAQQPGQVQCTISVYDWDAELATVELADELTYGYPIAYAGNLSTLHFARGESSRGAALYLDYFWEFNTQGYGTLRVEYDGALNLTGGVECDEFYASYSCHEARSNEALRNLLNLLTASDGGGWELASTRNWEEESADPAPQYLDEYGACYGGLMADMALEDPHPRSQWLDDALPKIGKYDPARENEFRQQLTAYTDYKRELISSRPDERYIALDGTLTALCGVCVLGDSGICELMCYDKTGLLDAYR